MLQVSYVFQKEHYILGLQSVLIKKNDMKLSKKKNSNKSSDKKYKIRLKHF